MKYIYPKLSDRDVGLFRLGGAGLGNILFTYARAMVYTKKHEDCVLIWPTWPSVKLGPILRHEMDKRFYNDLFINNSGYIDGVKKLSLLLRKKHISESEFLIGSNLPDDCIVDFTGFAGCFDAIINDSAVVKADIVKNLNPKHNAALFFDGKNSICMHVRLGDFDRVTLEEVKAGKHCSAIPIEWYVQMGQQLRSIVGEHVKIFVFSDGTDEELESLLRLPNTQRITTGSAIGDILALSNAGFLLHPAPPFPCGRDILAV